MSMSLSEYAGWFYQRPGVQPLLLELQDSAGADVLLLLTACWLGHSKVLPDAQLWQVLHGRQQPWQQHVIGPLRQVRRTLAGNVDAAELHAQVKACELAAEWHQLGCLEQHCLQWMRPELASLADTFQAQLSGCGEAAGDRRLQLLAALAAGAEVQSTE